MPKIAPDKWKHLFVGIAMGLVFQAAGYWLLPAHHTRAALIAFTIIVCISYGWELFSKFTGLGYYEVLDAVYSIVGGLVGMGLIWLVW